MSVGAFRVEGADNILVVSTHTVGITAGKVLDKNKKRIGYRVISDKDNTDIIYHGYNNAVSTSSRDRISPDAILKDEGDMKTVYKGEIWLVSGSAAQTVEVQEITMV